MLETLDYTIRIGSTPTILYFVLSLFQSKTTGRNALSFRPSENPAIQDGGSWRIKGLYFVESNSFCSSAGLTEHWSRDPGSRGFNCDPKALKLNVGLKVHLFSRLVRNP